MAKLKASTLIEVIVSLVIITSIMTLALMTYVNIISSEDLHRKTEASLYVQNIMQDIKKEHLYVDDLIEHNNITYQVSFTPYDETKKLLMVEIVAVSTKNKELALWRELLLDE